MSSKSKKTSPKTSAPMAPGASVAPVVEAVAPVVAPVPVVEVAAPAPVVEVAVAAPQKGGKRKAVKQETPVEVQSVAVEQPVVETTSVAKKGGAKKAAPKKATTEATSTETAQTTEATPDQAGGKPKRVRKPKPALTETPAETEADVEDGKLVRSFKVKLPDNENFVGRFTGLTPYQAANKALSKYFRETKNADKEITFLICESTRKSKKSVYTYIGKRYQLEVPVRYKIQDGREIVKNFKNSLKKVKKVDAEQTGGIASVVAPVVA
jgi:hypothetical protein